MQIINTVKAEGATEKQSKEALRLINEYLANSLSDIDPMEALYNSLKSMGEFWEDEIYNTKFHLQQLLVLVADPIVQERFRKIFGKYLEAPLLLHSLTNLFEDLDNPYARAHILKYEIEGYDHSITKDRMESYIDQYEKKSKVAAFEKGLRKEVSN